jgi:hypothetical protein
MDKHSNLLQVFESTDVKIFISLGAGVSVIKNLSLHPLLQHNLVIVPRQGL